MTRSLDRRSIEMPRAAAVAVTVLLSLLACVLGASSALADGHHEGFGNGGSNRGSLRLGVFTNQIALNGAQLRHTGPKGSEALSQPDDITFLNGHIFVAFQNGVGPQGESSSTGNLSSTVVELDPQGHPVDQWDVVGKCDGLTADPSSGDVIATVNEDANSSLYTIDPTNRTSGAIVHYAYSEPLPSDGGTDAISIYNGTILISASAPGTNGTAAPQPTYPAVYQVSLQPVTDIAQIHPLFFDESSATVANAGGSGGTSTKLMLTDPDSNEVVPFWAPRFAGDFMLTSQGDEEQIFVSDAGGPQQALSALKLSSSVDDTAWPSVPWGALYTTDNSADTVNRITGPFWPGTVFVADTPCDEDSAPSTCPAPGYPPNYLGELNPWTGQITPVTLFGPAVEPQGMLFLP
jgi:hypothetical protein